MVKDVTDMSFDSDVLERSDKVPVVVDLWAPWCGPCRTLGPLLERAVEDTEGKVELAKVNVDDNPRISASFAVQSIPAVFALDKGRVVDQFVGALPERSVREFVQRLVQAPSEADLLVVAGDEASLRRALELQPDHAGAVVALAELLVQRGESGDALGLLARLPESPDTRRVAALARLSGSTHVDVAALAGGAAGDDATARRLDDLLELVKEDPAARQEYLDILEAMTAEDPRREQYRRALAARLF